MGDLKVYHAINAARRFRLLPNLAFLALLEVVAMFVPRNTIVLVISCVFIFVYVAFLVLLTRDAAVSGAHRLSPWDRKILRWSGPLAVLIGILLIVLVACNMDTPIDGSWIESPIGLFTVKYLMEVGLVLSIACWCASSPQHVLPVALWRILVTPLVVIYGSYVILISLGQFAGGCDPDKAALTSNQKFYDLAGEDTRSTHA